MKDSRKTYTIVAKIPRIDDFSDELLAPFLSIHQFHDLPVAAKESALAGSRY